MKTTTLLKNLLAVGLITTAKIAANMLVSKEDDAINDDIIEVESTDLSLVLNDIRFEMNTHLDETPENQKLLRNYIIGRIATIDDIEKRLK
jgi:hypothetical protein